MNEATAQIRTVARRQFSSLAIYNFRLFFAGQLVSLVGTWMQTTGQAWLVLKITGSPLALGTVATLQFLPVTLFALFGGVFADRLPRRRVLFVTQSISMLQALILGLLVWSGRVELWHIYALALSLGMVQALDGPVRQAFIGEMVGRDQLVNAVALNSTIFNLARVAGPAVAGIVIGAVGIATAFFLNAASFVAVLSAYALMRQSGFSFGGRKRSGGNVFREAAEGVRFAFATPSILALFILLAAIGTFGLNFTVVIPLIAQFILHAGPERFGLLTSAMGVGSLVAALTVAAAGKASLRVMYGAAFTFVAAFLCASLSHSFVLTAVVLAALGAATLVLTTTINTSIQLGAPEELRGRVVSIYLLLVAGTTPIGGYLTGFLSEKIGVSWTLAIEAAICLAGTAASLLYRLHARSPEEKTPAALPRPSARHAPAGGE